MKVCPSRFRASMPQDMTEATMGRPHPMELRTRVVAFVEEGHSHR